MTAMTTDRTPTFTQWLTQQSTRDDAIGDLARDAGIDPNWPKTDSEEAVRDYLRSRAGERSPVLLALKRAIAQWRKELHDE